MRLPRGPGPRSGPLDSSHFRGDAPMMIHLVRQAFSEVQTPWLVLPLFEEQGEFPEASEQTPLGGLVRRLIGQKEISGSLAELSPLHGVSGLSAGSVLIVGLGPRARFD